MTRRARWQRAAEWPLIISPFRSAATRRVAAALILLLAGCVADPPTIQPTTSPPRATTIVANVDLPPQPMCRAYTGVGALNEVDDLWLYCSMGLDLVRAVDDCQRRGNRPDECLRWATTPETNGGAGLTGLNDAELNVAFKVGRHHLQRLNAWERAFDECEAAHGRDRCERAITPETNYPFPP